MLGKLSPLFQVAYHSAPLLPLSFCFIRLISESTSDSEPIESDGVLGVVLDATLTDHDDPPPTH